VAAIPACATAVKCYNTRLVIDTRSCNLSDGGTAAWIDHLFGGTTVRLVEEDSIAGVAGVAGALMADYSWPLDTMAVSSIPPPILD
jgi:hypothetical protein